MKRELAAGAKQTSTYARDTKVKTSTALRWQQDTHKTRTDPPTQHLGGCAPLCPWDTSTGTVPAYSRVCYRLHRTIAAHLARQPLATCHLPLALYHLPLTTYCCLGARQPLRFPPRPVHRPLRRGRGARTRYRRRWPAGRGLRGRWQLNAQLASPPSPALLEFAVLFLVSLGSRGMETERLGIGLLLPAAGPSSTLRAVMSCDDATG